MVLGWGGGDVVCIISDGVFVLPKARKGAGDGCKYDDVLCGGYVHGYIGKFRKRREIGLSINTLEKYHLIHYCTYMHFLSSSSSSSSTTFITISTDTPNSRSPRDT